MEKLIFITNQALTTTTLWIQRMPSFFFFFFIMGRVMGLEKLFSLNRISIFFFGDFLDLAALCFDLKGENIICRLN